MDLNFKINAAVSQMQREYGNHINQAALDLVAEEIHKQHRIKLSNIIFATFSLYASKLHRLVLPADKIFTRLIQH